MNATLAGFLYLVSASLFIVGLKRLTSPATAVRGNQLAAMGMLLAIVVTLLDRQIVSYGVLLAGLVVGGGAGAVLARRVEMTDMPQLVAVFNGFGGAASGLVAMVELIRGGELAGHVLVTVAISLFVGSVTFSGSMVAFAKLQGLIGGTPVVLPAQRVVDGLLALAAVVAAVAVSANGAVAAGWLLVGLAVVLGVTRTMPVGGADMPVVISFLNSMSGLAASAAGFVIGSNALVISGALVGAAGLILTGIMVRGMNRTLGEVFFSTFGGTSDLPGDGDPDRTARRASPDDVAVMLAYAEEVVVVPGYGLAVAQAQHVVRELADLLAERGVEVRYAIHPVAGRMPGHMNVLLAEADVPYDRLFDLEDINRDFPRTGVALVVGANDVVNPSARQPDTPVSGMPILDVDLARAVVVVKRSLSPGFAGIDNPLFYMDNTYMLFADAKRGLTEVISAVRAL